MPITPSLWPDLRHFAFLSDLSGDARLGSAAVRGDLA